MCWEQSFGEQFYQGSRVETHHEENGSVTITVLKMDAVSMAMVSTKMSIECFRAAVRRASFFFDSYDHAMTPMNTVACIRVSVVLILSSILTKPIILLWVSTLVIVRMNAALMNGTSH